MRSNAIYRGRANILKHPNRLNVRSGSVAGPSRHGQRAHTRTDHVRLAAGYLGWKSAPAGSAAIKDLEQFLLDRAMEHDSPGCCSPWRPST